MNLVKSMSSFFSKKSLYIYNVCLVPGVSSTTKKSRILK